MRLILVRHGETDGNKNKIYVGRIDLPLNKTGEAQAEAVANKLKSETVAAIYCSNLQRAKVTAQKIAAFHPQAPLIEDVRLRERDFGVYELRPYDELTDEAKRQGLHRFDFRPAQGESIPDAVNRAVPVIEELLLRYKGKTVVIVSHGALTRGLIMHLLHKPVDEEKRFTHGNTGFSIIDINEDGKHIAHVINDTSHLS